jgi:hypothetical protein
MVHNVQNTVESAREIISMIIKNNPVPLIIQEELVKDGKDITQTSAGKEVDKRLAELAAQYEVKLQDNIKAIQDAQKERDEETAREMKEEKETVQKKLDKLNLDRENQNKEYQRLQSQFQQAEQDRQREAKLAQDRLDAAEAQRRRDAIDAQNKINEAVAAIRQPPPTAPRPTPGPATRSPATLETIESGKRHTIRNVKNGRYVTLAANEKDSKLLPLI